MDPPWQLLVRWMGAGARFISYKLHYQLSPKLDCGVQLVPPVDPAPVLSSATPAGLASWEELIFALLVRPACHAGIAQNADALQRVMIDELLNLVRPERVSLLLEWMAATELRGHGPVLWPAVHAVLCAAMNLDSPTVQLWALRLGDKLHCTHSHISHDHHEQMCRASRRAAALSAKGSGLADAMTESRMLSSYDCGEDAAVRGVGVRDAVLLVDSTLRWLQDHPGEHHSAALRLAEGLGAGAMSKIAPIRARLQHHMAEDQGHMRPLALTLVALEMLPSLEHVIMAPELAELLYEFVSHDDQSRLERVVS
eukprot:TRINITY_DN11406_c0_g1_i4.p1 TRINITY_DN11406_c0_g1~~TRINITY_DN11406_c0_g1_i4.p1  ORF type:complete len:311 (+),score=59.41 TRINITY_DN11406_c0_g1_i4:207-1139(+)